MALMIAGLLIFLGGHSVGIAAPDWRASLIARIGPGRWKLAYSAVSLSALVLVVWGYGAARTNPVIVWAPPSWGRHAAALLTVIGFVLIAAAYVPATRIQGALGHPMTAGVALWALGHLIANGRLNAVILFGAFFVWAALAFVMRRRRDRQVGTTYAAGRFSHAAIAVVIGLVVSIGFALFLHGPLIGVRPFG